MTLLCHLPGCRPLRVARDGRDALAFAAEGERPQARCPTCRMPSPALHSRSQRRRADLPASGKIVRLHLTVRRFCCHAPGCPRRTFAERFPHLLGRSAHRTRRRAQAQARTGVALGGQPAARLLAPLVMPTSATILLRDYPTSPAAVRRATADRRRRRLGLCPGAGPTPRSWSTSSAIAPSTCCRIVRLPPWRLGSATSRRSTSWRATAPLTASASLVRRRRARALPLRR
jgi:hypothetical protein